MLREGAVDDDDFLRAIGGGEGAAPANGNIHRPEELRGDCVIAEIHVHLLVVVGEGEGTTERVVVGEGNEASGGDGFYTWQSGELAYDLMDVGCLLL